jgi:predicted dehydrogenase
VAIVGLGFGAVHAAAFRRDPRCEVVAMCGRDGQRATREVLRLGVPAAFDDWRILLDGSPADVVSLAVPALAQVEIGAAALSAGKHVFFEKPLADGVAGAERLAQLAHQHGRITAVNFEFPEIPVFREARRLVANGALGQLRHAAITWRTETYANKTRLDTWKARSAEGGGALNLFGSHVFYYVEWMLGTVRQVSATLGRAPGDSRDGDTLDALVLTTESGLAVVVTIATDAFRGAGHRIDVFGDQGTLTLENTGSDYVEGFRLVVSRRQDAEPHVSPDVSSKHTPAEDGRIGATACIVHRFLDAIVRGDGPPTPGIIEGVRVQRLIAAARSSSIAGRVVAIPP